MSKAEVGVSCGPTGGLSQKSDKLLKRHITRLFMFSPPDKIPWNLYYVHFSHEMVLLTDLAKKRRSVFESMSEVECLETSQSVADLHGDYSQKEIAAESRGDVESRLEDSLHREGVRYRQEEPRTSFNPVHTW